MSRHRAIFPGSRPPSIFAAVELNFCVRDGNRWDLNAISTGYAVCAFAQPDICWTSWICSLLCTGHTW